MGERGREGGVLLGLAVQDIYYYVVASVATGSAQNIASRGRNKMRQNSPRLLTSLAFNQDFFKKISTYTFKCVARIFVVDLSQSRNSSTGNTVRA